MKTTPTVRQQLMNTRRVPDQAHQRRWGQPRPVTARLVWQRSGQQHCDTYATRWAQVDGELLVCVDVIDDRRLLPEAWVTRADIEPRDE